MEVGEDALDPLRVVQPPLDPVSTCPQQHKPCHAETNSGTPWKTSKMPLTGCQVEPPDSCTPKNWKRSDLMRCHMVVLTISLSVGFLDSLHDPSAYVAPHDISEAAVPVYEHTLTAAPPPPPPPPPPDSFRVPYVELQLSNGQSPVAWSIQGPASVTDSSPGSQVPKVEIPQVVVACFLDRIPNCQTLYSMRASMSAVLPKPMLTGTHIQRPPF